MTARGLSRIAGGSGRFKRGAGGRIETEHAKVVLLRMILIEICCFFFFIY